MTAKHLFIDLIGFASLVIPAVAYNLLEKEAGWPIALIAITPMLMGITFVWRRSLQR